VQNTAAYRGATPDKKAVNLMTPIAFLDQQINRDNVTLIVHLLCIYMPATGVAPHFASLLYCTVQSKKATTIGATTYCLFCSVVFITYKVAVALCLEMGC